MRNAVGSQSDEQRRLDRIGEILSGGVALWLMAREQRAKEAASDSIPLEDDLNPECIQILDLIKKHSEIATGDVIRLMGLTRSTARRRLAELVSKERVELVGEGRGARYVLSRH